MNARAGFIPYKKYDDTNDHTEMQQIDADVKNPPPSTRPAFAVNRAASAGATASHIRMLTW